VTEKISSFEDVKRDMESDDFYCDISFASTVSALENRLRENLTTTKLVRVIGTIPETVDEVVSYANSIVQSVEGDVRSENDAALCACLLVLANTGSPKVEELFATIQSSAVLGLWWPRQLVQRLVESRSSTLIAYDPSDFSAQPLVGVNELVLA
jgi:hypothetical protein